MPKPVSQPSPYGHPQGLLHAGSAEARNLSRPAMEDKAVFWYSITPLSTLLTHILFLPTALLSDSRMRLTRSCQDTASRCSAKTSCATQTWVSSRTSGSSGGRTRSQILVRGRDIGSVEKWIEEHAIPEVEGIGVRPGLVVIGHGQSHRRADVLSMFVNGTARLIQGEGSVGGRPGEVSVALA